MINQDLPVPVAMVTKVCACDPNPHLLSPKAAQLPSLSTQTGRCSLLDIGVRKSMLFHPEEREREREYRRWIYKYCI